MEWKNKFKDEMKSGGDFIRLKKDGDEVIGVFRGEPVIFFMMFGPGGKNNIVKKEYFEVDGKGASKRFRFNFITKVGDKHVCKIFEGSKTAGETLSMTLDEYDITNTVFKIKRQGSGMQDTVYHFLFKDKLSPDQVAKINAIELLDIDPLENGEDEVLSDFPKTVKEALAKGKTEDIPF